MFKLIFILLTFLNKGVDIYEQFFGLQNFTSFIE